MDHIAAVIVDQGRAAWPDVALSVEAVARILTARDASAVPSHPADLYLALACAEGSSSAVKVLSNDFFARWELSWLASTAHRSSSTR